MALYSSTLYKSTEHEHLSNTSKLFGQRTHLSNSKHAAGPDANCGYLHQNEATCMYQ